MLVSQAVLVLLLSLALALLAVAAFASGTQARKSKRTLRVMAFAPAIVVIGCVVVASGLRFNFTPSMPLGIYRLAPVPKSGVQRGTFVAVCAPLDAAELGRRRGYLAAGPCSADTELLLKVVAAVAGDVVAVSVNGVVVNGHPLPRSRPLSLDGAGRRLSRWPEGRYRLGLGQLWLYADNARSWDSRYWGPAALVHVKARAVPLLVSRPIKRDWSMLTDRRFFANRQ
jgi:conjugative transfer signal peptidase TraF